MKKHLLLISFALAFIHGVSAQESVRPCTTELKEAVTLHSFHLGETPDQVDEKIPGFKAVFLQAEQSYGGKKGIDFRNISSASFENMGTIDGLEDTSFIWHFYENRLVRLYVKYEKAQPKNLADFVRQLSQETHLPTRQFKIINKHFAKATCPEFSLAVHEGSYVQAEWYSLGSELTLEDTAALKRADQDHKKTVSVEKAKTARRRHHAPKKTRR